MGIRSRKPTSPGRRFQTSADFSEITKSAPEKSLLAPKPKKGGRDAARPHDVAPPSAAGTSSATA